MAPEIRWAKDPHPRRDGSGAVFDRQQVRLHGRPRAACDSRPVPGRCADRVRDRAHWRRADLRSRRRRPRPHHRRDRVDHRRDRHGARRRARDPRACRHRGALHRRVRIPLGSRPRFPDPYTSDKESASYTRTAGGSARDPQPQHTPRILLARVQTQQLDHEVRGLPAVAVTLQLQGQPTVEQITLDINDLDAVLEVTSSDLGTSTD